MTITPSRVGAMQMELELPGVKRVEAAATAPLKASTQEIGYAQAVNYSWWLYDEETTPELIWPQSVSVFDAMRRTDAQVASVLRAVNLPVRRTQWRIDPAGARARVVKFVADDLGLPISGKGEMKATARTKDKFSWQEHLRLALLELVYGHMYFEQVYSVNAAGTEAHLKKLAPRMPKTIERIDVAPDGGLVSIKQWWTKNDVRPQAIPVDRLVAYVHDREGGNWLGQSILRPAYKNWLIKDRLLRVQAQTIERNGMGIPLYKAQEGASSADLAAGKSMATAWRAGEAAGSAVPFGADLILRGVEGTLPDADPAIRYHDEQIARAVLAHFLNLGTQTGSWALGATFADFFVFSLQTLAQQIADVTTQHVIEDLVDLNFGPEEPAPKLVFDEIGSQQAATAQALKMLVDAGVIHPDQVLEETSRQQYGLPPADPATATPAPAAPSATPEVPAAPGDMPGSVAAKRRPKVSRRPVKARYNPTQKRDRNGKWGDGVPGSGLPDLDMEGFDLVDEVEGTFGSAQMGVDASGDVRLAFHEGSEARAVDLGADEFADLGDVVRRLETYRDTELPADAESSGVYDDDRFGYDGAHKVELLGNGIISITFGADDPDPYTLNLDPPGEDGADDVGGFLRAADEVEGELDGRVTAAAGVDTHPGGEELKHYWVYGEGAAKWSTWTELYNHLKTGKGISSEFAKRIAAAWFHLRYGYWPGDRRNVHAKFNPLQKRDRNGEWGDGAPGASAPKDVLKLAGKIDLAPDEKLIGSGKVDGDQAGIRMALTERGGHRMLRLGVGGDGYGKADRETGTPAWDGNHAHKRLPEADRQRLDAEYDALDEEYDTASPARQSEISARQDAIKELLPAADDDEFNGTAKLDEYSMGRLADRIRPALAEAVEQNKAENDAWDQIEALQAKGNPDPDRMARLREIARVDSTDSITFSQGIIPGSEWGDVHYSVELDDPSTGATVRLGVWPKGAPDDWGNGRDWDGQFDAAETRKFLRLLDGLTKSQVTAAAAEVDDEAAEWEEAITALVAALAELAGSVQASFDPAKHPRGSGGKFRSTVDKLKDAIQTHRSGGGKGDPFEGFDREQLRRAAKTRGITLGRGEDRDSISKKLLSDLGPAEAPAPKAPVKRAPRKKAEPKAPDEPKPARKRAPAKKATSSPASDFENHVSGKDIIGSDPGGLARQVVAGRGSLQAADRSLAAIGQRQGFDGKPRVVSKAELDRLVKEGHPEIFRGVRHREYPPKSAAEVHEDMRSGPAFYGNGVFGNGYYWGNEQVGKNYSDNTAGSVARAVVSPDAKVINSSKLRTEHEAFLEGLAGKPDEAEMRDVYEDLGRYGAARGYDAILVDEWSGKPFYNVLNRTALVIEEGP